MEKVEVAIKDVSHTQQLAVNAKILLKMENIVSNTKNEGKSIGIELNQTINKLFLINHILTCQNWKTFQLCIYSKFPRKLPYLVPEDSDFAFLILKFENL